MSVEECIRERLQSRFQPRHMELENESHRHSVPPNSETHFKLVMVSPDFIGQRAVARHQRVYTELSDMLAGPVHALAMHLYDPEEWLRRGGPAPGSPDCLGGSKADEGAAR